MRTRYIEPDEVERIRINMPSDQWLTLWVAAEGGLRIGDVVALRVGALEGRKIRYRAQKTGKDGVFAVSPALYKALRAAVGGRSAEDWIFPSPKGFGKHITRQAVWQRVKRACKRAGVSPQGVAPHSFRKCFAVELFKREGLEATRKALQHDSARTTELYALSDFTSGANAALPLLRRDLQMIVEMVLAALKGREVET